MIPRHWASQYDNIPGVCDPGELFMTPGSQQPILKTFAQAFRDRVTKINMDSYSTNKGLNFAFSHKSSRIKFYLTPRNKK